MHLAEACMLGEHNVSSTTQTVKYLHYSNIMGELCTHIDYLI
jgi:hypothetical protein